MREKDTENNTQEKMPPSILIVDDEETISQVLSELVKDMGFIALVAANGREALTLAKQHWPDLIITDLMMPLMDGIELLRRLHVEAESRRLPYPPVMLLTAAGTPTLRNLHIDVVFSKPFELLQIEETLLNLLHADSA